MITGVLETIDGAPNLVLTRNVPAPTEKVWEAFTESDQLALWFGTWAGDPTSGRVEVSMVFEEEAGSEPYVIVTCEKSSHLRVHSTNEDAAQIWTLDVQLSKTDAGTHVKFAMPVPPGMDVKYIGAGWEYYLDRMVETVETGRVSTKQWPPYEALMPEYEAELG